MLLLVCAAGVRSDVLVAGCLPDPQRWVEVLDPQRQQAAVLPAMAQHVLNTTLQDMADALQASAAAGGAAVQPQAWLAAAEAWATHLLERSFTAALQGLGDGGQLLQLLHTIEVPVQRVLSAMEVKGVRCDRQVLLEQRQQLQVGWGRRRAGAHCCLRSVLLPDLLAMQHTCSAMLCAGRMCEGTLMLGCLAVLH